MTDAQWDVKFRDIQRFYRYSARAFRKKCITQKIVVISRESDLLKFVYRDWTVDFLRGNAKKKHEALNNFWNVIEIAERAIKELKNESK